MFRQGNQFIVSEPDNEEEFLKNWEENIISSDDFDTEESGEYPENIQDHDLIPEALNLTNGDNNGNFFENDNDDQPIALSDDELSNVQPIETDHEDFDLPNLDNATIDDTNTNKEETSAISDENFFENSNDDQPIALSDDELSNVQPIETDHEDFDLPDLDSATIEDEEIPENSDENFFENDNDNQPIALSDDELSNVQPIETDHEDFDLPDLDNATTKDEEIPESSDENFFENDNDDQPIALSDDELSNVQPIETDHENFDLPDLDSATIDDEEIPEISDENFFENDNDDQPIALSEDDLSNVQPIETDHEDFDLPDLDSATIKNKEIPESSDENFFENDNDDQPIALSDDELSNVQPIETDHEDFDLPDLDNETIDDTTINKEETAASSDENFFENDNDNQPIALSEDELSNVQPIETDHEDFDLPDLDNATIENEEIPENSDENFFENDNDDQPIALSDDELSNVQPLAEEEHLDQPKSKEIDSTPAINEEIDIEYMDLSDDVEGHEESNTATIGEPTIKLDSVGDDDWEIEIMPLQAKNIPEAIISPVETAEAENIDFEFSDESEIDEEALNGSLEIEEIKNQYDTAEKAEEIQDDALSTQSEENEKVLEENHFDKEVSITPEPLDEQIDVEDDLTSSSPESEAPLVLPKEESDFEKDIESLSTKNDAETSSDYIQELSDEELEAIDEDLLVSDIENIKPDISEISDEKEIIDTFYTDEDLDDDHITEFNSDINPEEDKSVYDNFPVEQDADFNDEIIDTFDVEENESETNPEEQTSLTTRIPEASPESMPPEEDFFNESDEKAVVMSDEELDSTLSLSHFDSELEIEKQEPESSDSASFEEEKTLEIPEEEIHKEEFTNEATSDSDITPPPPISADQNLKTEPSETDDLKNQEENLTSENENEMESLNHFQDDEIIENINLLVNGFKKEKEDPNIISDIDSLKSEPEIDQNEELTPAPLNQHEENLMENEVLELEKESDDIDITGDFNILSNNKAEDSETDDENSVKSYIDDNEGKVNFHRENNTGYPNRDDLKKIIAYLDNLLGELPEELIEKFSRSDYFKLYQKVMEELGL